MQIRTFFAALALAVATLLASQAQAWWVGPGTIPAAHHRYIPVDSRPVIIRGVNFQQDSDMLTHQSTLILDAIAAALKARPMGSFEVAGHTSADGGAAYNLELSTRRAKAVRDWLKRLGVTTLFIEPGSPWENGYVESLIGKLRDELLDGEIFYTLREAQVLIEHWRREYNQIRPHSSLGYRPPAPEAVEWPLGPTRPETPITSNALT